MTRDDIILLRHEASRYANNQTGDSYEWNFIRDERFAALVAAAEREACAKVCEQAGIDGYGTLATAAMIRARREQ